MSGLMVYGIGTDIVKTGRIKAAAQRWGDKFLGRIFTENEIAYSFRHSNPYLPLSVRFAAKEALIKAIGGEVAFPFKDIEIVNSDSGRPGIKLSGKIREYFEKKAIKHVHLSLSHEQEFGVAFVVLES